jgi:two-component system, chemotaxis family, response regulator WspF
MRIAIVNDLVLAREVLRRLVLSVPGYAVAWMAENGEEAVRNAAQDRPDIILMDLVMPVLDGVEATRRIMTNSPCPILLVTSTVTGNFNMVYRAMGFGGLDAVNTPTLAPDGSVKDSEGILARIAKIREMEMRSASCDARRATCDVRKTKSKLPGLTSNIENRTSNMMLVLGASTGGPDALACILKGLPAKLPAAVVIIQHIAADFAPGLARWLQAQSALPIRVAADGDEPKAGEVLLAGTNDHLMMRQDRRLAYTPEPKAYPYRPSVDVFFHSLAAAWPRPGIAVLLTGMGNDGAQGLLELRHLGWMTIAQDQATSVVHGMPRAAVVVGAACQVLALADIHAAALEQIKALTL